MGLDMFLYKKTYIGANYEHRNIIGVAHFMVKGEKTIPVQFNRISEVTELVAYWRKANAIHQWFVDNCQDGVDDCRNSDVTKDDLERLLDICLQVKKTPALAGVLLPTQRGFFFGSTDYDDWYWEDINYTIKTLKGILKEKGVDSYEVSFEYHSSW